MNQSLLVGGHAARTTSVRFRLKELGFTITEEISNPNIVLAVLEGMEPPPDLIVFVLSDTNREKEDRVIPLVRTEYPDSKIVCIGSDKNGRLGQGIDLYICADDEQWVTTFYEYLLDIRKES